MPTAPKITTQKIPTHAIIHDKKGNIIGNVPLSLKMKELLLKGELTVDRFAGLVGIPMAVIGGLALVADPLMSSAGIKWPVAETIGVGLGAFGLAATTNFPKIERELHAVEKLEKKYRKK